jgi:cell division protein ZapA
MPNVEFKVGNQKFDLVCDEGQQMQIKMLAESLDNRVSELSRNLGSAPDTLILVAAALMMEDELQTLRQQSAANFRPALPKNTLTTEQVAQLIEGIVSPVTEHIETLAEKLETL